MIGLRFDGVVKSWNHAAESLFGYSASEMLGKPVAILGRCEDRHQMVNTIRSVRSGGVVRNLKTMRIAKDGHKIPVLLTIEPTRDQSGTVTGMSVRVTDITGSEKV